MFSANSFNSVNAENTLALWRRKVTITFPAGLFGSKTKITWLQLINDISAAICICIIVAEYKNTTLLFFTQMLFFFATFVNSYLKSSKVNVICLWAVFFYSLCIISIYWTISTAGAMIYLTTMIKMVLIVVFISLYVEEKREIDIIFKSIIAGTGILALLLFFYTPFEHWGSERIGAVLGMNQNTVGTIFVYGAALCLYYARKTNLYFLLFIVFAAVLMFTGSRRAFILLILLVFLFFVSNIKKPSNLLYIIPFGLIIFALLYLSMNNPVLYNVLGKRMEGLINMFTGEGKVDSSTLKRLDMISTGINLFKDRILLGYGMNSFRYLNKYRMYSHNNYVELLVSFGLIGTVLYYTVPFITLVKSLLMWVTKSKEAVITLLLMVILLVGDYGMVTYYSELAIIIITTSYLTAAMSNDNKTVIIG